MFFKNKPQEQNLTFSKNFESSLDKEIQSLGKNSSRARTNDSEENNKSSPSFKKDQKKGDVSSFINEYEVNLARQEFVRPQLSEMNSLQSSSGFLSGKFPTSLAKYRNILEKLQNFEKSESQAALNSTSSKKDKHQPLASSKSKFDENFEEFLKGSSNTSIIKSDLKQKQQFDIREQELTGLKRSLYDELSEKKKSGRRSRSPVESQKTAPRGKERSQEKSSFLNSQLKDESFGEELAHRLDKLKSFKNKALNEESVISGLKDDVETTGHKRNLSKYSQMSLELSQSVPQMRLERSGGKTGESFLPDLDEAIERNQSFERKRTDLLKLPRGEKVSKFIEVLEDETSHISEESNYTNVWAKSCRSNVSVSTNQAKSKKKPKSGLNAHEILSDKQTKRFLRKKMGISKTDNKKISFSALYEKLQEEFITLFDEIGEEEEEVFRFELFNFLSTNGEDEVSLNALEIFTKEQGLANAVSELLQKINENTEGKRKKEINESIIREMEQLKRILEKKNAEIALREEGVSRREEDLEVRERSLRAEIEIYFEECVNSLEETYKKKTQEIGKKTMLFEKLWKNKLKLIEIKVKESKPANNNNDEKLKSKIVNLERSLEVFRIKNLELEKKLVLEKEINESLNEKGSKLNAKIIKLEKALKELASRPPQSLKEGQNLAADIQLDVWDLNSPNRGLKSGDKENTDRGNHSDFKSEETTVNSEKSQRDNTKGAGKQKVKEQAVVPKTKEKIKSKDEDIEALLKFTNNLFEYLKKGIPMYIKNLENLDELGRIEVENLPLDMGEVLFPIYNKIIPEFVEVCPVFLNGYRVDSCSSIIEIFYKIIGFTFRFQVERKRNLEKGWVLPEEYLKPDPNAAKQSQIQMSFLPSGDYWKSKNISALGKKKLNLKNDESNRETVFPLFSEEGINRELADIFRKIIENSKKPDVLPQGNTTTNPAGSLKSTSQNMKSAVISADVQSKHSLWRVRTHSSLLILLFSTSKKETVYGLSLLVSFLNDEEEVSSDFMKKVIVEADCMGLVFTIIKQFKSDESIIKCITDILLSMSSNGEHYKSFIEQISHDDNIQSLFEVFDRSAGNNELGEKLSVILQRITYHNSLKGKINENHIILFKERLQKIEKDKNFQFYANNLKSIILNLDNDK